MDSSAVPPPSEQDGDMIHCEEQLRTTLHCDDKEKLRRKLALLQREYLRTAERLQRAERLDAVRRHVRSRISQQNHQDQRDPEVTSDPGVNASSLVLNTTNGTDTDVAQCQGHTGGPADSANTRRSQVIRFQLPSDAVCPQTPDPGHDSARGHRPSPALRLRSRRSRLRWERRSAAEAGRSTDDNSEESEKMETEESEERVKTEGTEVVNESEELFSGTDSESPSLLLTHGNTCAQTETGDIEGKPKESESTSLLLTCRNPAVHTEEKGQDGTQNDRKEEPERGEEGETNTEKRDGQLCDDSSHKETVQNAAEMIKSEKSRDNTTEIKEEISEVVGGEREVKGAGLLDSCTLVEGLLFPAEYYVRTTRRMTLSHSQPDMQAVILSQLSTGRPRRSRGGRGRGANRHTHTGVSSPTSSSASPRMETQSADSSAELNSQSCGEVSHQISACQMDTDAPAVTAARSARGRRRRRGRGRGRPQTPRCSLSLDTRRLGLGDDPTSSPVTSSPSLRGAEGPKPGLAPGGAVPVQDDPPPASTHSTDPQPSAPGLLEKVYPIFLKSGTNGSTQMSSSAPSWRSLLLPSSPPAHTSVLPLPSPSPGSLLNNLMNLDLTQDFHLPDDEFAALKLLKLRQVAVDSGVERLTSPSYNTRRRSNRRCDARCDPATPLPLPLSLTPTITNSPCPSEVTQAPVEHTVTDGLTGDKTAKNLQCQTTSTGSVPVVQDDQYKEKDVLNVDHHVKPQPHIGSEAHSDKLEMSVVSPGEQTVVHLEDQRSTNHQTEDNTTIRTLSFEAPEEFPNSRTAAQLRNDGEAPGESPVQHLDSAKDSKESTSSPPGGRLPRRRVPSQLLMSPPPASAAHLPSSALLSSPALPSLGLTPHPLSCSPSAPALTLPPPPPHSPSTQALSPPPLSPCPSVPPSQPPAAHIQASSEPAGAEDPSQRVGPPACCLTQGSGGQEGDTMRCTHTLKAPAGGALVDVCCLPGPSGGLCVAAAGKWAVCLWSHTAASDWSLTHTWAFNEPVINVFPVPDAAGLMCVTLGQLEIREVRMLSCSSLSQAPLCEDVVQAVVGVSRSRVVTSSHSASGSTLQVFTLSDAGSTLSLQPLVSPGVCVGALAPVDGLSDALIGSDEGGRLFVWNLKTGQLLRSIVLGEGLSHTACLSGYSDCGVLFVLLQHQQQQLSSTAEDPACPKEEKKKTALFSLVAVNPLSGKSVPATRLYPPRTWTGRLCEADVHRSSVVGLSQSGCVCVWELGRRGASRAVRAPESDGWQLARWGAGGGGTLVTGHHNGDVSLHCCSTSSVQTL